MSVTPAELDGLSSHTADLFPSLGHGMNPFPHLQGHITIYSFVTNYHRLILTICRSEVQILVNWVFCLGSHRLKSGCHQAVFLSGGLSRSFKLLLICLWNQFLGTRFLVKGKCSCNFIKCCQIPFLWDCIIRISISFLCKCLFS